MAGPDRYHRQIILDGFGAAAQERLSGARAVVIGCGALGGLAAELLCRAGVGTLVVVDRDLVETTNLQRQTLFEQADADEGLPKAEAARRRLAAINPQIHIEGRVTDCNPSNVEHLVHDAGVILDGTDNFETRFLLNDAAVSAGIPMVYGGAVAGAGMAWPILPKTVDGDSAWEASGADGACLRCAFDQAPPPGTAPTCDTAGVLGPVTAAIASIQAAEAIKILIGDWQRVRRTMLSIDLLANRTRETDLSETRQPDCPCCGQRRFEHLAGDTFSSVARLCGRNAIQVNPAADGPVPLGPIAQRLAQHGRVVHNDFLVRVELADGIGLTCFEDGRTIVHGTNDPGVARSVMARYVGV